MLSECVERQAEWYGVGVRHLAELALEQPALATLDDNQRLELYVCSPPCTALKSDEVSVPPSNHHSPQCTPHAPNENALSASTSTVQRQKTALIEL